MTTTQEAPTFTAANMVTGMCLWEALLALAASGRQHDEIEDAIVMADEDDDARSDASPDDGEGSDEDLAAKAEEMLGDHGSFTLRAALVDLAKPCEEAWDAHIAGKDTSEQFDWEWCPAFIKGSMRDGTLEAAIDGQYRP